MLNLDVRYSVEQLCYCSRKFVRTMSSMKRKNEKKPVEKNVDHHDSWIEFVSQKYNSFGKNVCYYYYFRWKIFVANSTNKLLSFAIVKCDWFDLNTMCTFNNGIECITLMSQCVFEVQNKFYFQFNIVNLYFATILVIWCIQLFFFVCVINRIINKGVGINEIRTRWMVSCRVLFDILFRAYIQFACVSFTFLPFSKSVCSRKNGSFEIYCS